MFQSTHPQGVRQGISSRPETILRFQSTHPQGVRQLLMVYFLMPEVSIHAPARGATTTHIAAPSISLSFNPRTREGCDCASLRFSSTISFQSTHPRGVRHIRKIINRIPKSFNPRTREGCDGKEIAKITKLPVSIHAPARGATKVKKLKEIVGGFNPRTREGCDGIR